MSSSEADAEAAAGPLQAFSTFLLDLPNLADEPVGGGSFRERALARLAQWLPFDSAVWASGRLTPQGPDFHTVQLWRQPPELLIDYESVKHLDPLFQRSAASPGRAFSAEARTTLPAAFMPLVERYGLAHAMSTITLSARSGLLNGISVWRSAPDRPFRREDEAAMEAAFPHLLKEAEMRLLHGGAGTGGPAAARACADASGCLHAAGVRWLDLMQTEDPAWCGPLLPPAWHRLLHPRAPSEPVRLQRTVLRVLPRPPFTWLELRLRVPWDDLSPRVQTVAGLAAGGQTHKAIARQLGLAPATVRNHLAQAYAVLGIHSRTGLAACLQAARFAD